MLPRRSATPPKRHAFAALLVAAVLARPAGAAETCPIPQSRPAESEESHLDASTWEDEARQALPQGRVLDPERVGGILAALQAPKPPAKSLWERFLDWVNAWLARNRRASEGTHWLTEWLAGIEPWVARNVLLAMLGLLVIGLGVLAIVELRAAGAGRRRQREARGTHAAATVGARRVPTLAEIAALPLRDQPPALLQWVIRRFVDRQILPADASLTNGELLAILRARAPAELTAFHRLTRAAEASVYGAIAPADAEMRELLDSAGMTAAG